MVNKNTSPGRRKKSTSESPRKTTSGKHIEEEDEEDEDYEEEEGKDETWKERDEELDFNELLSSSSALTTNEAEILAKHCYSLAACKTHLEILDGMFLI